MKRSPGSATIKDRSPPPAPRRRRVKVERDTTTLEQTSKQPTQRPAPCDHKLLFLISNTASQTDPESERVCPRWPSTFDKQQDVCTGRWAHAYVHDSNGRSIVSDIYLLMTAVRRGWNIKLDFIHEDLGILTSPWRVYIKGSSVCAEVLVHLGVQWSFLTKCTNGDQGKKTYLLDTERYANLHKSRSGMTSWFVRKENYPVLTNETNAELERGAGVRIVTDRSNETAPLFTYDSTKIAFIAIYDRPAVAENMWSHEIDFSRQNAIFPSRNNNWRFRRWFTDDNFAYEDRAIASSGEVVHPSQYLNPVTWLVDPCWERVFVTNSGSAEWGSATSLLYYIRKGHKVKAIFQGMSLEADTIFERDNYITAQFVSQVARYRGRMTWVWQLVTTDGHVQTVTNTVGTRRHRIHNEGLERVEWYVDTRPWREVLTQQRDYTLTCGSFADYSSAVKAGQDIRLALHYKGYRQYVTPDSIGLGANLQASFNRGIGYDIDRRATGTGIKFHLPPYWDFFVLRMGPSSYYIQRLRRIVGTNVPVIGEKPVLHSVQWFAVW